MAENAIIVELIPDDADVDMNEIINKIHAKLPAQAELKDYKIEPFVFGLKKIRAMIIVQEEEGVVSKIEELLNSIEGVSAEIQSITRL